MDHADFRIGQDFWCSDRLWRCTDVGQRVIVAIRIDEITAVRMELATMIQTKHTMTGAEAEREGSFDGPPYGVAECVFDEYDFEACTPTREEQ